MFLVVTYVCLNNKVIKSAYTFCNNISNSIKNYVHHGENQSYQEVVGRLQKQSDACVPL